MNAKVLEKKFIVPFVLITSLFALWGFANDITNPMVAGISNSNGNSSLRSGIGTISFLWRIRHNGYSCGIICQSL